MQQPYPILEFSPEREGFLEPSRLIDPLEGMPEHLVMCFFQDVLAELVANGKAREIAVLRSEIGRNPVFEVELGGTPFTVIHPGVGAPLASAFLEEVIALGARKIIACGGAGVLVPDLALGHLVVPTSAVRDEGTSYHYMPPSHQATAHPAGVAAIENTLQRHGIGYLLGKTWTTDAIYRETPEKILRRRAEGCLTVEMEASAFFAVAQFREVILAQILYGGDDLSGATWDSRNWTTHSNRETIFWLAAEACLSL